MGRLPVLYSQSPSRSAEFYERIGFERTFQLPEDGDPGYIALRRDDAEMAIVSNQWPREQYGVDVGPGPCGELFVYVDDVDTTIASLTDAGIEVLRDADDMAWGERVGYVRDPDGNPVALAAAMN